MRFPKLVLCALALIVAAGQVRSADGATYAITAEIFQAYDADFVPLPEIPDYSFNLGEPHFFSIEFTLHASGFNAQANQRGFGNILFDINLAGDSLAPRNPSDAWFALNQIVDTNGPAPGENYPLWLTNEDSGIDPDDLKSILVDIATIPNPHPDDPRPEVGSAPGTAIGRLNVYWDGTGPETLSVDLVETINGPQVSYARIDNGQFQQDANAVFSGATIVFGGVDPPVATGDFNGDGAVDGADFVIWQTNFPNNSGEASLAMGDANGDGDVDGADFVVWQTNFPTAGGEIAAVPEPQAVLLISVGGIGLVAARRFRIRR